MAALEQTGPAGTDASGRGRLVQALGEVPGESAGNLLRSLLDDPDAAVARTARYLLDTSGAKPLIKKKYVVVKNDYIHHMLDVYHI